MTPMLTRQRIGAWQERLPLIVELVRDMSRQTDPQEMVRSYDPATGKELWSCKAFNGRGEPTVAPYKDQVIVVNGLVGDIYSIKTGGSAPS